MEETTTVVGPMFDPKTIDTMSSNVYLSFKRTILDGEAKNILYVSWKQDYNKPSDHEDNQRPAWADIHVDERVWSELDDSIVNHMTRAVLQQPNRFRYELPCPPYTFDIVEGKLQIEAGAFSKAGSKAEWTVVLQQMQEEVEGMADGIDCSELPEITVSLSIRASTSIDLSVDTLLSDHDMYDGELFNGDKYELEQALVDAIDEYDFDNGEIDMDYIESDEITVDSTDMDYMLRQVTEG